MGGHLSEAGSSSVRTNSVHLLIARLARRSTVGLALQKESSAYFAYGSDRGEASLAAKRLDGGAGVVGEGVGVGVLVGLFSVSHLHLSVCAEKTTGMCKAEHKEEHSG